MLEEQRADRLDAIWKEIKGLVDLGTFSLEPLPAGQRALDSRIVLKVKYRADGSFDKNKARDYGIDAGSVRYRRNPRALVQ